MLRPKFLKLLILISLFCALGYSSCDTKTNGEEQELPELSFSSELQRAIEHVLYTHSDYDLGFSAAVIVPGEKPWTGVSGNSHKNTPITADMLFDIGSVEKNFEAALVLKLAEAGLLSLDAPISMYLPTYPNVNGEITIRQLLNHTSGVFNVFEHPDFPWVRKDVDYAKAWTEDEVFKNFVLKPYGPPGYAQHYSSTNYLLLTLIIEEVTGSTIPDEIERYFLEPMKLENTFVSMNAQPPANYTVAHPWVDIDQDGTLDDLYGIPLTWKVTLSHPVMFSTPKDLVEWVNALYHEGTVISPDALEEMLTYPDVILLDPEGGLYGLGVVDYSNIVGSQVYGHLGSSLGYSAAALYLPEYNISMAWVINTGESPQELAAHMMQDSWSAFSDVFRENQEK